MNPACKYPHLLASTVFCLPLRSQPRQHLLRNALFPLLGRPVHPRQLKSLFPNDNPCFEHVCLAPLFPYRWWTESILDTVF